MLVAGHRRLRLRRRRRAAGVRRPGDRGGRHRHRGQPRTRPSCCETLGADVRLGPGSTRAAARRHRPGGHHRLEPTPPAAGRGGGRAGSPIWSEPELAWRLSRPDRLRCPGSASPAPTARPPRPRCWSRCCAAAGLRTAAVGNIGRPVMETVLDPEPYDVLAVELSSHQLHWSNSLSLHSAAVLNLQPDHFEWHGGATGLPRRQGRDLRPACRSQLRLQRRRPGHRADGRGGRGGRGRPRDRFHPGHPRAVDARRRRRPAGRPRVHRAAPGLRARAGQDRATSVPAAPHNVANALAAAALARVLRGAGHGRPGRSARRSGWAPTRSRRCWSGTACASSTTPRPPTRTPPTRPCGPFDVGGLDRRRPGQGDDLRRLGRRPSGPAAWRRAARRRPRGDRRGARPTRARCPGDHDRGGRD